MNYRKFAAVLIVAAFATVDVASAASFGRSSSSSSSAPRSSYSAPAPSYSAPKPAPAPAPSYSAPARSSAIGGTTGSMGVRKTEVTAPVAAKVDTQRAVVANNTATRSTTPSPSAPSYNSAPSYATPAAAAPSSGPGFGTIFGGTVAGVVAGNALTNMLGGGNHGTGGTTVMNNGGGSGYTPQPGATAPVDAAGNPIAYAPAQAMPAPAKSYGIGSFIWDVISIAFLIAVLALLAFLGYKGFKMARNYINRERGVAPTQPFAPTAKFWEIQNAFAAADVATLRTLLGPDLVDEATQNLEPCEVTLEKVSHETVLSNPREFSVHYSFFDKVEQANVDQVWHYELHGGDWKLNGIETV